MPTEIDDFQSTLERMEKILLQNHPECMTDLAETCTSFVFPLKEERSLASKVMETGRLAKRIKEKYDLSLDYSLLIERYLDLYICLYAQKERNLSEQSLRDAKTKMQRHERLSLPCEKDAGYILCTYENLIKAKTWKDYQSYKKYYGNEIGL